MRWSEKFAAKIEAAIGGLPVLASVRELFDYEVIPVLITAPGASPDLRYLLALSLPVTEGGPDYVQVVNPEPADPTIPQAAVDRVVRALADAVLTQRDKARAGALRAGNSQGPITGKLIVPSASL